MYSTWSSDHELQQCHGASLLQHKCIRRLGLLGWANATIGKLVSKHVVREFNRDYNIKWWFGAQQGSILSPEI